jgi:hypothetical protein
VEAFTDSIQVRVAGDYVLRADIPNLSYVPKKKENKYDQSQREP